MTIRVEWRASVSLTGTVLKWLAVALLLPLALAVFDGDDVLPFVAAIVVTTVVGLALERTYEDPDIHQREAFLVVALTWLGVAVVGAIPFVLADPANVTNSRALAHPVNALFESMSGITTTGATVIEDFDDHSRAVLFWRQLIQWLGGLGILVVAIGLLSNLMVGGAQLMETETQTQNVRKLRPHIGETARLIWWLYVGLTLLAMAVLYGLHLVGLAPNMDLFNAVSHGLTSVSTAGFSPEGDSIGAFSPAVQWALMPFMILGATNIILLYYLTGGDLRRPLESDEFRFYVGMLAFFSSVVVFLLLADGTFSSVEETVRHGLFNVISITTTTGYASADFDLWTPGAKHMLFLCMFIGGMAGSTTCSIKALRWVIVLKAFRRNLFLAVHPRAVRPIRLGGEVVDEETIRDVYSYVLLALVIFFALTIVIVSDAARAGTVVTEFDAMGAAASIFLNIGPAFGEAGPFGNYLAFPTSTRAVMVVMMWVGRIEIIPVLVLLTRAYWTS
ncbi:TrkH family potassium uptake protein [Natronobiforma cellulositropha]|uniref:TrkH family potassium uptake protein n=1 Tax=Natronobiforma cellulositropha TaxID=1679076 RepID=UPI0021D5E915|nr:TrkH family potassium uptake protein [Natronobiforma cellulositropha]